MTTPTLPKWFQCLASMHDYHDAGLDEGARFTHEIAREVHEARATLLREYKKEFARAEKAEAELARLKAAPAVTREEIAMRILNPWVLQTMETCRAQADWNHYLDIADAILALINSRPSPGVQPISEEAAAEIIYSAFPYTGVGDKPAWKASGNAIMQDLARDVARKILSGTTPEVAAHVARAPEDITIAEMIEDAEKRATSPQPLGLTEDERKFINSLLAFLRSADFDEWPSKFQAIIDRLTQSQDGWRDIATAPNSVELECLREVRRLAIKYANERAADFSGMDADPSGAFNDLKSALFPNPAGAP